MHTSEILRMNKLGKLYGHPSQQWAMQQLDLEVHKGQVWGLLGPNGSGKTTTLGMILGCIRPTQGTFSWFQSGQKAHLRRRIGALLEKPYVYPHLTGWQNLRLVAYAQKAPTHRAQMDALLARFHLSHAAHTLVSHYSLGMLQRLALASALVASPEVLVLDEPTNGLDAEGIILVREEIQSFAQKGGTVILASHILDEVEKVCSHVAILHKGALLESGHIRTVLNQEPLWHIASKEQEGLLVQTLKSAPSVIEWFVQEDGSLFVSLRSGTSGAEFNRYLSSQGVYLDQLFPKRLSLEQYFLELVRS